MACLGVIARVTVIQFSFTATLGVIILPKSIITPEQAAEQHGIVTAHEQMDNGELRFRLTPTDGNGYIRTVAGTTGAWQNAHSHKSLRETYIVERGWIASAEMKLGSLSITVHELGAIFTTEPNVSHNIYLSKNTVIHTVKHEGANLSDWVEDKDLSILTKNLSETEILKTREIKRPDFDRFPAYMTLYNNLDNLLWRVPNFLAVSATITIGFLGTVLSRNPAPRVPPLVFSMVFAFSAMLFLLGYVSMSRLREHHTMVGDELASMEATGYFYRRSLTVKRRWPIAAPNLFRFFYLTLSLVMALAAILVFVCPDEASNFIKLG
jgi:mannose-6-phosphate isomerase-like protein (cupin superfamily)